MNSEMTTEISTAVEELGLALCKCSLGECNAWTLKNSGEQSSAQGEQPAAGRADFIDARHWPTFSEAASVARRAARSLPASPSTGSQTRRCSRKSSRTVLTDAFSGPHKPTDGAERHGPPVSTKGTRAQKSAGRRSRKSKGTCSSCLMAPHLLTGPADYGGRDSIFITPFVSPAIGGMNHAAGPPANLVTYSQLQQQEQQQHDAVIDALQKQMEYYFSAENLQGDFFMRCKMDRQGYLPVALLSTFNRVQIMTRDVQAVVEAIQNSPLLELKDGVMVRPVTNAEKWPISS